MSFVYKDRYVLNQGFRYIEEKEKTISVVHSSGVMSENAKRWFIHLFFFKAVSPVSIEAESHASEIKSGCQS